MTICGGGLFATAGSRPGAGSEAGKETPVLVAVVSPDNVDEVQASCAAQVEAATSVTDENLAEGDPNWLAWWSFTGKKWWLLGWVRQQVTLAERSRWSLLGRWLPSALGFQHVARGHVDRRTLIPSATNGTTRDRL